MSTLPSYQLWYVESGLISIEDFKWVVHRIEEGMKEDTALRAFAATLQEFKGLPLASETYLELAKRKALHDGRPAPFLGEGIRLASVLLADYINDDNWEIDWDGEIYTRLAVAMYMDNRDLSKLLERVDDSERSPTEWEVLEHICVALAARGEDPPEELLRWWFRANHGLLKRPDGGSAPRDTLNNPAARLNFLCVELQSTDLFRPSLAIAQENWVTCSGTTKYGTRSTC